MLPTVTVWSTPNAANAMEVDAPVVLSPTSGAVVALKGSVSVRVDFSAAAFGTYAVTVSGGSGNLAEPFVWGGSNARASVRLDPLDESGTTSSASPTSSGSR